jgi:AraC-like DNA-binding protein
MKTMPDLVCREHVIAPDLRPFIKSIWSLEGSAMPGEPSWQRILPDGAVELVFHFADRFETIYANGRRERQPWSFVVGQMDRFIEISPRGEIGFIAVRFHARGAYRFFRCSLKAVAAGVVDARAIWKHCTADQIASVSSIRGRLGVVEQSLRRALRCGRAHDRVVDAGLQLIESNAGQLRVSELASEIGVSARELTRRFENAVGVSPKQHSRIIRFVCALNLLRERKHHTLTDLALACGYFDQAHFNHDVRELGGIAPREIFVRDDLAF